MGRQKNWSILVKPTCDCNINCDYCFALAERKRNGNEVMTHELVEHIAKLSDEHAEEVQWIWHGGEPTLVGPKWYRDLQYIFFNRYNTRFHQKMQSNGTLIDDEWINLLKDYDIAMGISFDAFCQESRTSKGNVLSNIQKIEASGEGVGVITVITNKNYTRLIELYEYFKSRLHCHPSFNQVFDINRDNKAGFGVKLKDYEAAFQSYYRYWLIDASENARAERSAMTFTKHVIGDREHICTNTDCRLAWLGISPTGEVFPCDRQFNENYMLGKITEYSSIQSVYEGDKFRSYYYEVEERFTKYCNSCGYGDYCQGGCNANAVEVSGSASGIDEAYCELFKMKFNVVYDELRRIDIYKDKLNMNLFQLLAGHPFFPVKEIRDFLSSQGYRTNWDYSSVGRSLLDSTEFKIFRIFNIFKGEGLNKSIDYINYSVDICNESFKSLKKKRCEILFDIFDKEQITIDKLIGKSGEVGG